MAAITGLPSEAFAQRGRLAPRLGWLAGAGWLLLLATAQPAVAQQATPSGTEIRSWAEARYVTSNGSSHVVLSDTLVMVVGQVAGVDLEPSRASVADPADTVVFPHMLTNLGNGPDGFALAAASRSGWSVTLYHDSNRSGTIDAQDAPVTGALTLVAGDTAHVLLAVAVPGSPAVRGAADTIAVTATSAFDASVSDRVTNVVAVRDPAITVSLVKLVDRAMCTVGDVLTYTIVYEALGSGTATGFTVEDLVPLGTTYLAGTMQRDGVTLTDATGDDTGEFVSGGRVVFSIGTLAGGDRGTLAFQVRVAGSASPVNSARATYATFAGVDTVTSNEVQTTLVFPRVELVKLIDGARTFRVGEEFAYRIGYRNVSPVMALDAVLTDSLSTALEFVSAGPAADVAGQQLRWQLGDLAPGASGEVLLRVRVSGTLRDTVRVVNVAHLVAQNAAAQLAAAPEVELIGQLDERLAVTKSADLLEVGLGEVAPYSVTLENTGVVPLSDLRIHDRLPDGARYAIGSAVGADSALAAGRELTLFVVGPLVPGATHTVRYAVAVVSAEQDVIQNVAYATADADRVRSDSAVAWLRVRHGWPLETRAVIGKVWVDLDADGFQDPNEPGVEGVDIWTADGVVVTTDAEGKFSLANLRPGRHAFRLDRSTLPAEYGVGDLAEDLVIRDLTGWTTPRVNFPVLPREARIAEVRLPVHWSLAARPQCGALEEIVPGASGQWATIAQFSNNGARPSYVEPVPELTRRIASWAAARPGCEIALQGHADTNVVAGVPYLTNYYLSKARADRVTAELRAAGLERSVNVQAYGSTRPIGFGTAPDSLALNRRVEIRIGDMDERPALGRSVMVDLVIDNPYSVALGGMTLELAPVADSVVAFTDDEVARWSGAEPALLPTIPSQTSLSVHASMRTASDGAVAVLAHTSGRWQRLEAAIHNPVRAVADLTAALAAAPALPMPTEMPAGGIVEVVLAPPSVRGSRETVFRVPQGWEFVPGTGRIGDDAVEPRLEEDRSGAPVLRWRFPAQFQGTLMVGLRPVGVTPPVERARIPALRAAEERDAERAQAFLTGPGVAVFEPADGTVFPSDRAYIGVRGEPGAPVALFDASKVIAEGQLRIDGVHDFIAIPLSRGPHRLRVRMRNGWGKERWDSLAVHVSGPPARYEWDGKPVRLIADGHTIRTVRVRVVDEWGVPVVNGPLVTVAARGAEPVGQDGDRSSVGLQLRPDAAGWLAVNLKPGRDAGPGLLALKAGESSGQIPLEILPAVRPLMITGMARAGVGASPDAFGVLTVRGAIDQRTSVLLTYDTRHLDAGRSAFARTMDPLEQSQYPVLGDASVARTMSASRYPFAARVERGFDWIALGDIGSAGFAGPLRLAGYQRALSGAAARVTTGSVVWQGFGSSTSQQVQQAQIRGTGISGPFTLAQNAQPGTERVVVETRALDNPLRVLARQELVRFVDYQIDYRRGTLLLRRPVPASDTYGNPLFIMVTYEASGAGPQSVVWGLRTAVNARDLVGAPALDSVRVGATLVHDGQSLAPRQLVGADIRLLALGRLDLSAEVARSQARDSSDLAVALDGAVKLADDALQLSAGWLRIGQKFHNPTNIALRGGSEEVRLGSHYTLGTTQLRLEHQRQVYDAQGLTRERTMGGVQQRIGAQVQVDAGVGADRFASAAGADVSRAGELKLTWRPQPGLSLWTEGRRQFAHAGQVIRPDHLGVGAAYRIRSDISLELAHRHVWMPEAAYDVTNLGVRTHLPLGSEAWGSYQFATLDGGRSSALLGLNQEVRLGGGFSINALFERRVGLDRAPLADPVRALPFVQPEEDYWSAALGFALVPAEAPYRLTARGEYRDGALRSNRLVTVAGDLSISRSLAVLSRQEAYRTEQLAPSGPQLSRQFASLWGLALRPVNSDRFNALVKAEWIDADNPLGGSVLSRAGHEARLILTTEAIWAPLAWGEFAARYAARRTAAELHHPGGLAQPLRSWADFVGGRAEVDVAPEVAVRGEARWLMERTSRTARWDLAPQVAVRPLPEFEVVTGYRLGNLRDPDFAVAGGHGWFLNFGVSVTEQTITDAAGFWRARF